VKVLSYLETATKQTLGASAEGGRRKGEEKGVEKLAANNAGAGRDGARSPATTLHTKLGMYSIFKCSE
jgi:hypothetical protein